MKRALFLVLTSIALLLPPLAAAQMDKAIHAAAGFGVTITITAATNKPKLGLIAGIGAGVGKEVWDANRRGHQASAMDCVASVGASAGAYALWKLVLNRQHPPKVAAAPTPVPLPHTPLTPHASAAAPTTPQESSTPPANSGTSGGGENK